MIYRGPWKQVSDDDNHVFPRGARIAVCEKSFEIYSQAPYKEQFILVPPFDEVLQAEATEFDGSREQRRHPRETKGQGYKVTSAASESCCSTGPACCTWPRFSHAAIH